MFIALHAQIKTSLCSVGQWKRTYNKMCNMLNIVPRWLKAANLSVNFHHPLESSLMRGFCSELQKRGVFLTRRTSDALSVCQAPYIRTSLHCLVGTLFFISLMNSHQINYVLKLLVSLGEVHWNKLTQMNLIILLSDVIKPFVNNDPNCLELFARYLLPNWTSAGDQVLALQNLKLFTKLKWC